MSPTPPAAATPLPPISRSAAMALAMNRAGLKLTSRMAPDLARRWATHLFLKPPQHPHPGVEREWLARAESLAVTVRGRRVAAWRWGRAASQGTVLLAHGWGGRGTQLHAFIAPLLDAGYGVATFDAPAHGFSESRYATMLHFGQSIQAVAEAVGGVRAVIAHSMGGAATALALDKQWLQTERVVLISPPTDVEGYSRMFAKAMGVSEGVRQSMQRHLEKIYGFRWQDIEGGRLASRMRLPALVIHDRNDREVPLAAGERIASHWSGAQFQVTEGLGHRRILRDAGVVDMAVRFLGV